MMGVCISVIEVRQNIRFSSSCSCGLFGYLLLFFDRHVGVDDVLGRVLFLVTFAYKYLYLARSIEYCFAKH